jgi:hypothetical protein
MPALPPPAPSPAPAPAPADGALFPAARLAGPAARPLCAILVDAEEDFDWHRPVQGVAYDLGGMRHLADLQTILAAYGAMPTYLLTYPVLQDAAVVAALRRRLARGQCGVGIQLHTWVTPPFGEPAEPRNSFAANLTAAQEERKLLALMQAFRGCFGADPTVFRAGRYGLGRNTPGLLERHGFRVDTSLAPCTSFADEGGPDFSAMEFAAFWFGRQRRVLELPLCRSIVGWGGRPAASAYRRLAAGQPAAHLLAQVLPGLLAWSRCAERVTLSPEGNDSGAVGRLVAALLGRGQRVLALSLHSSSLSVGRNPYVQSRADLHRFYDQLSAALDLLAGRYNVGFVDVQALPGLLADG